MENEKSTFNNPRHTSFSATSSSTMHKLVLNHDVFRYGVIRAHSKINENNLRRIIVYALKKKELNKNKLFGSGSNSTLSRTSSADTQKLGQQNNSSTSSTPNQSENSSPLWPNISWQTWRYVATEKVGISETLAWAYWDTFCAVTTGHDQINKHDQNLNYLKLSELRNRYLNLDEFESQMDTICSYDFDQPVSSSLPKGDHWEKYRETEFLPSTTKFVLFLFIQQLAQDPKKSLRRSLSGENWPESGASDTECDKNRDPGKTAGKNGKKVRRDSANRGSTNINDETSVINFIKENLTNIMNVFNPLTELKSGSEFDDTKTKQSSDNLKSSSKNNKDSSENRYLTKEFTNALNILLNLFNHDIAKNKFTQVNLDSIFGNGSTSEKQFKSYVQANLDKSPFGFTGIIENGIEIPGWFSDPVNNDDPKNQLLCSDSEKPDEKTPKKSAVIKTNTALTSSHKKLFISGLKNSAVMRHVDLHLTSDFDVLIYRCIKSTIFLTGSFKSVSIEKCSDCTIVIGSVYSASRIITSRGCKVSVATRSLSLANSSDCTVNTLTPGHPLVLCGCRRIVIGPYNTSYANADDNLKTCGLGGAELGDIDS